jgi:hypothetical protein
VRGGWGRVFGRADFEGIFAENLGRRFWDAVS